MGKISIFQRLGAAAVIFSLFSPTIAKSAVEVTHSSPYQASFDPAIGFRPAQPNLTKIFLQLAGSLEYYGTPEPYLRHVMAEHARIDALYQKATGKTNSSRPSYFTDAYLENLVGGWNKLTPILKLDNLCRQAGRDIRYAIAGGWNKSIPELVAQEANLSDGEKATYGSLLQKQYFTKADFPAMETFYKAAFDKLSADGKTQISTRTWRGQLPPEKRDAEIEKNKGGTMIVEIFNEHQSKVDAYLNTDGAKNVNSDDLEHILITRLKLGQDVGDTSDLAAFNGDALRYSHDIETALEKRFVFMNKSVSADQAKLAHDIVISMIENLLVIAHSEFMAALRGQIAK